MTFRPDAGAGRLAWLIFLLLAAASFASFSPAFNGDILLDDFPSLFENRSIQSLSFPEVLTPPPENPVEGRPIANLTFALNFALSGFEPLGYRLVNWLLHFGSALLVYRLLVRFLRLCGKELQSVDLLAAGIALVWACHPLHSATVPYIAQRTEVLAGFFLLATVWLASRGAASDPEFSRNRLAAIVCCALGMGSKEVAAVAPLVVVLLDRAYVFPSWRDAFRARGRFYLALCATWGVVAYLYLHSAARGVSFDAGVSSWKYFLTQSRVVLEYARLVVVPHPLIFDRGISVYQANAADYKFLALTSLIGVASLIGFIRSPRRWVLPILFFVLLATTSSFVPIWRQPMAENRVYLPSLVVLSGIVLLVHRRLPRAAWALILVGLVVFIPLSRSRSTVMASDLALAIDTAEKAPGNPYALLNLGTSYLRASKLDEAEQAFLKSEARPATRASSRGNLATIYELRGRVKEAVSTYEQALAENPWQNLPRTRLVRLYARLGEFAKAQQHLDWLLKNNLFDGNVHLAGAIVAIELGQFDQAAERARISMEVDPTYRDNLGMEALALVLADKKAAAIPVAREGLSRVGNSPFCRLALALSGESIDGQSPREILLADGKMFRDSAVGRREIARQLAALGEDAAASQILRELENERAQMTTEGASRKQP